MLNKKAIMSILKKRSLMYIISHVNLKDVFFSKWASDGIGLEKYCIEFAELSIHETELMEQVYMFLYGFCI